MINVASLCCGIGGFEVGILNSSFDSRITLACDFDKYACKGYHDRFGVSPLCCSIDEISDSAVVPFDILVAGFPCQPYSKAGNRMGLADFRSSVIFMLSDFLKKYRPRSFLFENVSGLLDIHSGKDFNVIMNLLRECGYYVDVLRLNSLYVTQPIQRERLFFVGHLIDKRFVCSLPKASMTYDEFVHRYPVDDVYSYYPSDIIERIKSMSLPCNVYVGCRRSSFEFSFYHPMVIPPLTSRAGGSFRNRPMIWRDGHLVCPSVHMLYAALGQKRLSDKISDDMAVRFLGNSVDSSLVSLLYDQIADQYLV